MSHPVTKLKRRRKPRSLTFAERYLNGRANAGSLSAMYEQDDPPGTYLPSEDEIAAACRLAIANREKIAAAMDEPQQAPEPPTGRRVKVHGEWGTIL